MKFLGIAAVGLALLAVLYLASERPAQAAPPASFGPPSDPGVGPLGLLPGVGLAYRLEKPVEDNLIAPLVSGINHSDALNFVNSNLGGRVTTTQNADGTITRKVQDNWYTRNIGSPISHAGTSVVHFVASLF